MEANQENEIQEAAQADVVITGEQSVALQKQLGVNDRTIELYKGQYLGLRIDGLADLVGYEIAQKASTELMRTRTSLDKKRKALNKPYEQEIRQINGEAKRLQAQLTPIENHVKGLIREIDFEKNRIADADQAAALERLEARVTLLSDLEMRYSPTKDLYTPKNEDPAFIITLEDVRQMYDDQFESFYELAKAAYDKEMSDFKAWRTAQKGSSLIAPFQPPPDADSVTKGYVIQHTEPWLTGDEVVAPPLDEQYYAAGDAVWINHDSDRDMSWLDGEENSAKTGENIPHSDINPVMADGFALMVYLQEIQISRAPSMSTEKGKEILGTIVALLDDFVSLSQRNVKTNLLNE